MEALTSAVSPPVATATRRHRNNHGLVFLHPPCGPANNRLTSLGLPPASITTAAGNISCSSAAVRRLRRSVALCASSSSSPSTGGGGEEAEDEEEVERALGMDGSIPGSSGEFVRHVSSRAYDMRRHLAQIIDSISYDVLETNPWREDSKPVYVLTQRDNQLCTMKTRRNRSEVERELGLLFSKGGKRGSEIGNKAQHSKGGTKFQVLVEDIREGVLVFEDARDAGKYCDLLQGGGQGCEGIAEVEASSVFDICHKMRALAVLFRRGRTPPLPKSLEQNLRARNRSLED